MKHHSFLCEYTYILLRKSKFVLRLKEKKRKKPLSHFMNVRISFLILSGELHWIRMPKFLTGCTLSSREP